MLEVKYHGMMAMLAEDCSQRCMSRRGGREAVRTVGDRWTATEPPMPTVAVAILMSNPLYVGCRRPGLADGRLDVRRDLRWGEGPDWKCHRQSRSAVKGRVSVFWLPVADRKVISGMNPASI